MMGTSAGARVSMLCIILAGNWTGGHAARALPSKIISPGSSFVSPPCSNSDAVQGSVVLRSHDDLDQLEFVQGLADNFIATGAYMDSDLTISNFGKLRIKTSSAFDDLVQLRAAGFLEGWLTAGKIYDHWHNLKHYFLNTLEAKLDEPMQWLDEQHEWAVAQVVTHSTSSNATKAAYWRAVGLAMEQWEGLVEGYQARSKKDAAAAPWLERADLLFLHSNGDLYDILDMYDARNANKSQSAATVAAVSARGTDAAGQRSHWVPPRLADKTPGQLFMELANTGKCSALIKVLGDLSDIMIGHSTWDSYTSALRIFKHYEFDLNDAAVVPGAARFSFSSYPGELFSDDDLWMTGSGLVVLETTNHIYNSDLFKVMTPRCVLSWQRVRAANLLASDGERWVQVFSEHQSGTYNNQMMVLDLAKFKPKKELQAGLLWVAEQLPGLIVAADMTEVLMRGYWPSYNVPYFAEVYNASGIGGLSKRLHTEAAHVSAPASHWLGESARWLRYQSNPRANIMRRDQGDVQGLADMRRTMRFNNWATDPYSAESPMGAMCGRGDLAGQDAIPKGCQDSKVTTYQMALRLEAEVVNGPTTQDGSLPAFDWDDARWAAFEHRGQPRVFNFKYERQRAADLPLLPQECHQRA